MAPKLNPFAHRQQQEMSASTSVGSAGSNIVVTLEDQEKINRFARLQGKLLDLTDDTNTIKNELQNIEDVIQEIELKMMEDDEESENKIQLLIGEIFTNFTYEEAQKWIEEKQNDLKQDLESNVNKIETIKDEMGSLKNSLYAKFGKNNIHLDVDELC